MIKATRLKPGDRVAAVSHAWGGPGVFPERYAAGKRQFEAAFGVSVVEMPHTPADPVWLERNPGARAGDLMQAFADPSINGIIASIGGEDSIRLLPFLDLDVITQNPKVFVGYSDSTVIHLACLKAGLVSFYGPSVMSGFAENGGLFPYMEESFRKSVFEREPVGLVSPNLAGWTVELLDWSDPASQATHRRLQPAGGWNFLQGRGVARGPLIGGCLEVLEWCRGLSVWPSLSSWRGAILFLETSEEGPSPTQVARALRVYGAEGVLEKLSGILFARPGGAVAPEHFGDYDEAILKVVAGEFGLSELPIVTGMDFGHTDPFMTLPYGVQAEIDVAGRAFRVLEAGVV